MRTKMEKPVQLKNCSVCSTQYLTTCHVCSMIEWTQEQSYRAGIWAAARALDSVGYHDLANKLRYPEESWTGETVDIDVSEFGQLREGTE